MARGSNPSDIFLGSTQANGRAFLSTVFNVLGPHYDRLVIPCVGKFAMAESALQSLNWKMEKLETSDISLFSTLLGKYIMDEQIDDMGVMLNRVGEDPVQLFGHAEVLYEQKLAVMERQAKNYHAQLYVDDLKRRKDVHMAKLQSGLDGLREKLSGLKYEARDLTEHFESVMDDPKSVVWLAPPINTGDYGKMFDTGGLLTWNEPKVPDFDPKTGLKKLLDMEDNAKALVLRHRRTGTAGKAVSEQEIGHAIFGEAKTSDTMEYTLCNRPDEVTKMLGLTVIPKKTLGIKPYKAPMLPVDYEITEESVVSWVVVDTATAMYYRDLFAHRMGLSGSEQHQILLIDGYVVGVVGTHYYNFRFGKLVYDMRGIEETYGMVVFSDRHLRLNRLLLMLICTRQFLNWAVGPDSLHQPEGIATTCLSRYPEHKTSRGIMKRMSSERQNGGMMAGTWFKLRYASKAIDETYSEVIKRWLTKHGQVQRTTTSKISTT